MVHSRYRILQWGSNLGSSIRFRIIASPPSLWDPWPKRASSILGTHATTSWDLVRFLNWPVSYVSLASIPFQTVLLTGTENCGSFIFVTYAMLVLLSKIGNRCKHYCFVRFSFNDGVVVSASCLRTCLGIAREIQSPLKSSKETLAYINVIACVWWSVSYDSILSEVHTSTCQSASGLIASNTGTACGGRCAYLIGRLTVWHFNVFRKQHVFNASRSMRVDQCESVQCESVQCMSSRPPHGRFDLKHNNYCVCIVFWSPIVVYGFATKC